MKKYLKKISVIGTVIFGVLATISIVYAAVILVPQGGTGADEFQSGSVLIGAGQNAITTTTAFTISGDNVVITGNASTTFFYASGDITSGGSFYGDGSNLTGVSGGGGGALGWSYNAASTLLTRSTTTDQTLIGGAATTSDAIFEVIGLSEMDGVNMTGASSTSFYINGDLNVVGNMGILDADVPDTITIDLAATATALAANGANCGAGSYPLGVDASGAVESCTDATTEINSVVNGLGGTNLTCSGQSCNVDDKFIKNDASDIMVGTLTADGLMLGANENITLGSQTLDHDGTTFVFNDDVNITGSATSTIAGNVEISGNASTSALFIGGANIIRFGNGICIGENSNTTTPNITIQQCSEF